jgi:hypothetical protein
MKAGRKNLQRACQDGTAVTLAEGNIIMQVITLRGSNLIEVHTLLSLPPFKIASWGFLTPTPCSVLGHGWEWHQVPGLVSGQVPEKLLDQER